MPEWNEPGPEEKMTESMGEAARAQIDIAKEMARQSAEAKRRHAEGLEIRERENRLAVAKDILCAILSHGYSSLPEVFTEDCDAAVNYADALIARLAEPKK